jgi:hypothetical protein
MNGYINDPKHWRARAEEAEDYEHLARRAEDRALRRLANSN